jgi:hypothetical protein
VIALDGCAMQYGRTTKKQGKVMTMKKVMAVIALVMMVSGTALAHSGGTDANGCHAGKKPYHCH